MEYRQHASMGVLPHSDYFKHVSAMTKEELHSKAEIAEELAVRDMRIKDLEAKLAAMSRLFDNTNKHCGEVENQLTAMTQERDNYKDMLKAQWACPELLVSQAYAAQLREALVWVDNCPRNFDRVRPALSLPQDDTALREWGAKLLEEMADTPIAKGNVFGPAELRRKAAELEAGK